MPDSPKAPLPFPVYFTPWLLSAPDTLFILLIDAGVFSMCLPKRQLPPGQGLSFGSLPYPRVYHTVGAQILVENKVIIIRKGQMVEKTKGRLGTK